MTFGFKFLCLCIVTILRVQRNTLFTAHFQISPTVSYNKRMIYIKSLMSIPCFSNRCINRFFNVRIDGHLRFPVGIEREAIEN